MIQDQEKNATIGVSSESKGQTGDEIITGMFQKHFTNNGDQQTTTSMVFSSDCNFDSPATSINPDVIKELVSGFNKEYTLDRFQLLDDSENEITGKEYLDTVIDKIKDLAVKFNTSEFNSEIDSYADTMLILSPVIKSVTLLKKKLDSVYDICSSRGGKIVGPNKEIMYSGHVFETKEKDSFSIVSGTLPNGKLAIDEAVNYSMSNPGRLPKPTLNYMSLQTFMKDWVGAVERGELWSSKLYCGSCGIDYDKSNVAVDDKSVCCDFKLTELPPFINRWTKVSLVLNKRRKHLSERKKKAGK